ncbi:trpD [Symbiodinium sp. CCMP2456]|nr:trpD [Symbiodinium sp. CCMP2456]
MQRRTSRSRSPAKGDDAGEKEDVQLDSLVQIGAGMGLSLDQAFALGEQVLSGQIARVGGDIVQIKQPSEAEAQVQEVRSALDAGLLTDIQHGQKTQAATAIEEQSVPEPVASPDSRKVQKEPSEAEKLLADMEKMSKKFKEQLSSLQQLTGTPGSSKVLKDMLRYYGSLVSTWERCLSKLMPMEPLEDLQHLPVTIEVRGFMRPECNRDFQLDKDSNLNGKPVYRTKDDGEEYFLYWTSLRWRICKRLQKDHGSNHDLQHAVRWGAERFVAEQCEGMETSYWVEFYEDGGYQMLNIVFNPVFEDLRQPQTPPEFKEEAFVVDKTNFPRSQPPKGYEAGLYYHLDTSSGKMDRKTHVTWGKTIRGVAYGNYVKVGTVFLPCVLRGRKVLTLLKDMDRDKLDSMRQEFSGSEDE